MQKIILIAGIMLISYCSFGGNPPAAVQKAFAQKFEGATNVKWGKESSKEYEAEFTLKDVKMSANFSTDGTWLETESGITAKQLPEKVSAFIAKTYPGWEIIEATQTETAKKGIFYETEIKKDAKKKEITLTAEGIPTS